MGLTETLSFVLSHTAFLGTHAVFFYWLNFLLNDPFNLGVGATLDTRNPVTTGECGWLSSINWDNVYYDLALFSVWLLQHHIMARKVYKKLVGLWEHPLDRPIFATFAWPAWFVTIHYWKPISDCHQWDPLAVPTWKWAVFGSLFVIWMLLTVTYLWYLPDHVFGTSRHKPAPKRKDGHTSPEPLRSYPYGLVRHPAAAGFLWMYWTIPNWNPNHVLLASMWSAFILWGTLIFEEGGLKSETEFGVKYKKYAEDVAPFHPRPSCVFAWLASGDKKKGK